MKTSLKFAALLLSAFILSSCSDDELVQPQEPFEDLTTSAATYSNHFLTIKVITTIDDKNFKFKMYGDNGKISVNWGDGTVEKRTLGTTNGLFEHTYDKWRSYTITVSGLGETARIFIIEDEDMYVNSLHLGGMPNLKDVILRNIEFGPEQVNISQNRKLQLITFRNVKALTDIVMPTMSPIVDVDLRASTDLTIPVIDRVVGRVYDYAIATSFHGGTLFLQKSNDIQGNQDVLIGPPSSYTINKLKKLESTYNWAIEEPIWN